MRRLAAFALVGLVIYFGLFAFLLHQAPMLSPWNLIFAMAGLFLPAALLMGFVIGTIDHQLADRDRQQG